MRIKTGAVFIREYTARGAVQLWLGTSGAAACPRDQYQKWRFDEADSRTLLADPALGAVGVDADASADNPVGIISRRRRGLFQGQEATIHAYGYSGGYQRSPNGMEGDRRHPPDPRRRRRGRIHRLRHNGDNGYDGNNYCHSRLDSHPRAAVLYGVGYLPLPVPFFDVYGKPASRACKPMSPLTLTPADIARRLTTLARPQRPIAPIRPTTGSLTAWACSPKPGFAFRAEYERISSQFGDPDALTVSATWTF